MPATLIAQVVPPTAALFAGDGLMSPYPDLCDIPNPAPLVARIVPAWGGEIWSGRCMAIGPPVWIGLDDNDSHLQVKGPCGPGIQR